MESIIQYVIAGYLLLMSLMGFIMMGVDKHKSRKNDWRIPERTLILLAFLGGGIGSFLGMYAFRHKTKHLKFVLLLPVAAGCCILLLLKIYDVI